MKAIVHTSDRVPSFAVQIPYYSNDAVSLIFYVVKSFTVTW